MSKENSKNGFESLAVKEVDLEEVRLESEHVQVSWWIWRHIVASSAPQLMVHYISNS